MRKSSKEDVYESYSQRKEQNQKLSKKEREKLKEEEKIKKLRTFPKLNTVFIVLILIAQIAAVAFAVGYEPEPKDEIKNYEITVQPLEDGTLDIEYSFEWQALDPEEDLTWVEIGTANTNFKIYQDSLSDSISRAYEDTDDYGYSYANLTFERPYRAGETVNFYFKINQGSMLCEDDGQYFYSFVPGWFNAIPVDSYTFRWKADGATDSNCNEEKDGYLIWHGTDLEPGGYVSMDIDYDAGGFKNEYTGPYLTFDNSGASNDLKSDKQAVIFICVMLILGGVALQVIICDSYVSYYRGRGFMTGYGYPIHMYGRTNPKYTRAAHAHAVNSGKGGSFHGGGCACACACACAGGGRAGCSQKDTYDNSF